MAAEYKAVYQAIANFTQLVAESKKAEIALRRMEAAGDKTSVQFDEVGDSATQAGKDVKKGMGDADVATSRFSSTADRAVATVNRLSVAHADLSSSQRRGAIDLRTYHDETVETSKDHDTLTKSISKTGGAGRGLISVLKDMGSGMGRVRFEARNFGAVLQAIKIPAIITGIKLLTGWLSALGAGLFALIPNLAQVTTLVSALPGLLLALAGGAAAAVAGLSGVGNALKAALAVQQDREMAQYSGAAATSAAESAERAYTEAVESQKEAQEALADAYRDARYALQDLRMEQERGELSVKRAEIALKQSRRNLQELQRDPDVNPTDLEYQSAVLDVQEAELNLQDARRQSKRTAEELQEAEKKGIENSDQVTAAQERLADATYALAQAQKASAEGFGTSSAAMDKYQYALSKLTPEARTFVEALLEWKPVLQDIRAEAQRNLLPYLTDSIRDLLIYAPMLEDELGGIANTLGEVAKYGEDMLTSGPFRKDFQTLLNDSNTILGRFGRAFWNVIDALRNVAIAARPVVYWISAVAEKWSIVATNAAEAGRRSGELQRFFEDTIGIAQQLGGILANLWRTLVNLGSAAKDTGQWMWDAIDGTTERWAKWTGSVKGQNVLKEWFDNARPAIEESFGLLGDFIKLFATLGDETGGQIAPLIQQIRAKFIPALERLFKSVSDALGPAFVDLVTNIADLFAIIGGQGGTLIYFLNVLNTFLETVLDLIDTIPGLKEMLNVFFAISGTVAGLRLVGSVFGLLGSNITKATGFIGTLVTKLGQGTGALSMVATKASVAGTAIKGALSSAAAGPVGLAIVGVGLLVGGLIALDRHMDRVNGEAIRSGKSFKKFSDNIETVDQRVRRYRQALASVRKEEPLIKRSEAQSKALDMVSESLDEVEERLEDAAGETLMYGRSVSGVANDDLPKVINGVEGWNKALDEASKDGVVSFEEFLYVANESGKEMQQQVISQKEFEDVFRQAIIAVDEGALSMETYNEYVSEAGDRGIPNAENALADYRYELKQTELAQEAMNDRIDGFNSTMAGMGNKIPQIAALTGQSVTDFLDEGRAAFGESEEAGRDWVRSTIAQLKDVKSQYQDTFFTLDEVLQDFAGQQKVSSDEILDSFREQNKALEEYGDNFEKVSERAVSPAAQDMLREITEMGLDGAGIIEELATTNDEEFNEIVREWKDGQQGAKDLGTQISDSIGESIDELIEVLRDLPRKISIAMGIETNDAREDMRDFVETLREHGLTLAEFERRKGGTRHTGGWAEGGTQKFLGPKKRNEVDARLQKGEFVVQRKVAQKNPGFLKAFNAGRLNPPPEYHTGGWIGGTADANDTDLVTSGFYATGKSFQQLKASGKLKTPKFKATDDWSTTGLGKYGSPQSGYTPNMWKLDQWFLNGPGQGLRGGAVPVVKNILGTNTPSQHSYGNARDYFGTATQMMSAFRGLLSASAEVKKIMYHVIHAGQEWVHGMGTGTRPYSGTTNMHYDHIHLGAYPPRGYAKGGMAGGRDSIPAMLSKGEFVLNSAAVKAIGAGNLMALNAQSQGAGLVRSLLSGPVIQTGSYGNIPRPDVTSLSNPALTGIRADGMEVEKQRPINLTLMVDGKTLTKTVEVHGREARLLLGGSR